MAAEMDWFPAKRVSRKLSRFIGKEGEVLRSDVVIAVGNHVCRVALKRHCCKQEVYQNIASDVVLNDLMRPQNDEVTPVNVVAYLKRHFPNEEGIIVADEEDGEV